MQFCFTLRDKDAIVLADNYCYLDRSKDHVLSVFTLTFVTFHTLYPIRGGRNRKRASRFRARMEKDIKLLHPAFNIPFRLIRVVVKGGRIK